MKLMKFNLIIVLALVAILFGCSKDDADEIKPVNLESEYVVRLYSDQKFSGEINWVVSPVGWGITTPAVKLAYTNHEVLTNVTEYTIRIKVVKDQSIRIQLKNMTRGGNFTHSIDGLTGGPYQFRTDMVIAYTKQK